ncbi:Fc.00g034900.m01.CDS01 [Cosmosporella sp. VM-42]
MMAKSENHALVFGATGLIGWAIADQLLSGYPEAGSFSRVTAVSNRPVNASGTLWASDSLKRPELQLVSGVNLRDEDVTDQLRAKVEGVEHVTHVFYFVFSPHDEDHIQECQLNCDMMRRVADAMNELAPDLKSFVYSGGTRGYGIYVPNGTFTAPLEESMADNLPEDYAKTVAYPWFRKILTEAGKGRAWTWSEVCPDAVVGFSPIGSNFSLALHWAQYLSLYARNSGIVAGSSSGKVEVPFPGNEGGYNALFTPVSSRILGQIAIYAALNPERCGGKVLNMVDNAKPTTFGELWPVIAGWFDLVGVGPAETKAELAPSEYIDKYRHVFKNDGLEKAITAGVGAGSKQLDSVGYWLSFDRQLSAERLRSVGFTEEVSPAEGWLEAFEKFRTAGIIF